MPTKKPKIHWAADSMRQGGVEAFCGAKNIPAERILKEGGDRCTCHACWAEARRLGRIRFREQLYKARA